MHILTYGERISINAQEGEGEDLAFTQRHASPQFQPTQGPGTAPLQSTYLDFTEATDCARENPNTILGTAEEEVPMEQPAAFITF